MHKSVCEIVRDAEENYLDGSVTISDYVEFDMHDTIETIESYINSKHLSGSTDSLGREKPFFNIVTAATNIWYRATDIDRKDIRIVPDNSSTVLAAYIATVHLQNWMKEARFGQFLNKWGRTLAKYGSAVVKFVEKNGTLVADVIPWNRLIVDPISFDAIPRIEKLYLTPEQLRKNEAYDKEMVEQLIEHAKQTRETLEGNKKDNQSKFIEIYEVHGEMPLSLLTDKEEDEETFVQQMHVVSFTTTHDEDKDYTLYRGREARDPYMITHLIEEDGRTLAIGAVEHLFDAQWMMNHTVKNMKDTLDLASKIIMQTSDLNYAGRNVLTALETGDIMVHSKGEPLTQTNLTNSDITALQNFGTQWQNLASEITSTPDAIKGTTLPSGTPYSLGAYLGSQANSLFEIMTENKGLYIEEMMFKYVIPHLKKKMNSKDEIVAVLDANQISEIDAAFIPSTAIRAYNRRTTKAIANLPVNLDELERTQLPSPYQADVAEADVQKELEAFGNRRIFRPDEMGEKAWKEVFKDFDMNVSVEVTNENTDKQAVLTTLSSLLTTVASNPAILQDPNAKMLFSQILTETGRISPVQVKTPSASPPIQGGGGTEALQNLTETNQ